ncbi:hypothetical protein SNEBB_001632, partial [Seison nebaliae]
PSLGTEPDRRSVTSKTTSNSFTDVTPILRLTACWRSILKNQIA